MSELAIILLIMFLGYLLGSIKVKGIQLGTSGVLLVALVFGHFGYELPKVLGDLGLVLFVGAVGYISGPIFIEDLKSSGLTFLTIGVSVILIGFITLYFLIKQMELPVALALGLLSGALTSTPGLGSALEATGGSELVTAGYGIAYVFGVIGVILFVQIMPKLSKISETERIEKSSNKLDELEKESNGYFKIDKYNLSIFSLAVFLGVIVGGFKMPLGNGLTFSLGTSGGPLLMGIVFGAKKKIGKLSLDVDGKLLENIREIGLILFLMRAGLASGDGFLEILFEYGYVLFIYGAILTLVPMIFGYMISRYIFKNTLEKTLGSLTGAMTSTPALGTLMETFDGDVSVGSSYAATYPVALVLLVLIPQIFVMFL